MARGLSGLFGYGESELDPAIQAEIQLETARAEARLAIWTILVTLGIGLWFQFKGPEFTGATVVALVTVIPFLADAQIRRSSARRLAGIGPKPARRKP